MIIKGIIFIFILNLGLLSYLLYPQSSIQTGRIYGVNHVSGTHMQWFTVNSLIGFDVLGECCSFIPNSWKIGETLSVEWQVVNDPPIIKEVNFSESISPIILPANQIKLFRKKVKLPSYSDSCNLQFHFLPCEEIIIIPSCQNLNFPPLSIQEPLDRIPHECHISLQ
ncbi:DUF3304 domain-containing protein [Providencia sp. PROV254]|uniref:DUF3304 domain-containing protein n=1 Tax=Providencia sp. PROV254 TaxID=2949942 RepID=UPI0023490990|nr:DUF3304 domain-containing protein [Providencia sp. PROV254]